MERGEGVVEEEVAEGRRGGGEDGVVGVATRGL